MELSTFERGIARIAEWLQGDLWINFFSLAPHDVHEQFGLQAERHNGAVVTYTSRLDIPDFNNVVNLGMEDPATEELLDGLIEIYRSVGVPRFVLHLSPAARPEELRAWLAARGMRQHEGRVVLYHELDSVPDISSDLRIEELGAPDRDVYGRLVVRTYDWPQEFASWLSATVAQAEWRHFAAYDGDRPAAVGAIYVAGEAAMLTIGATDPAYDDRNAQRDLLVRRMRYAHDLGCKTLIAHTPRPTQQAPAPSYDNLSRLGFKTLYEKSTYVWQKNDDQR